MEAYPEKEINWSSVAERYQSKVEAKQDEGHLNEFSTSVLDVLHEEIERLFGRFNKEGFSIQQAEDDVRLLLSNARESDDAVRVEVYQNIINLINARDIVIRQ